MSCNTSYITMESSKLGPICSETIERIESKRKEMFEATAQSIIDDKLFWKKIFWWIHIPTIDEAMKAAKAHIWHPAHFYAWRSLSVAKELKLASQYAESVNVSSSDLDYIV